MEPPWSGLHFANPAGERLFPDGAAFGIEHQVAVEAFFAHAPEVNRIVYDAVARLAASSFWIPSCSHSVFAPIFTAASASASP